MQLDRLKTWTEILTTWIGVLSLIAAGSFGIFQYLDKKRDDRIKETLEFLDRYNGDVLIKSRERIADVWRGHDAEQNRILNDPSLSADDFYAFTRKVIHDENLSGQIAHVHDFFAALYICVENQICEKDVAILLFQADARAYFNQHYAYIVEQRARGKDATIGGGLEKFKRLRH